MMPTQKEGMNQSKFPHNWGEKRVQNVLARYESQSEEEAVAEDEVAYTQQRFIGNEGWHD